MENDDKIKRSTTVRREKKKCIIEIRCCYALLCFVMLCSFAEFIEGSPHLRNDEILDYETSHIRGDTDSDITTDDNSDIENEDDC